MILYPVVHVLALAPERQRSMTPKRFSPARIALLYALFAACWIIGSDALLTFTVSDAAVQNRIELAIGILFIAITAWFLYLLLDNGQKSIGTGQIEAVDLARLKPLNIKLLLLFSCLALVVPATGVTIIKLYEKQIEQETFANLQAVAKLKSDQIENWLKERQGNSLVIAMNQNFANEVAQFKQNKDAQLEQAIMARLIAPKTSYGYRSLFLLDTDGQWMLGDHEDLPPDIQVLLDRSLQTQTIQRSNLFHDKTSNVYMDWLAPLIMEDSTGKQVVAYVAMRVSAHDFLFPLIQTWPTASPSGETLLIRRDSDHAVFLNELRHQKGTALDLRQPITRKDMPAVIACNAQGPGTTIGKDYRGKLVLAAFRPVTGTDWRIVAKIDRSEVMSPLQELIFWGSFIAFIVILSLSLAIMMFWRQQRQIQSWAMLRQKQESEQKLNIADVSLKHSQEHTQALIDSALDAIIGMNQNGLVVAWNPQAETIFGYAADQAIGREIAELIIPPAYREAHRKGLARFMATGEANVLDTRMELYGMRADGSEFPVELTISLLMDDDKYFFNAFVRDITERKQMLDALTAREAEFHMLAEAMPQIVWITRADGWVIYSNQQWANYTGLAQEESYGQNWNKSFHPDDRQRALDAWQNAVKNNTAYYSIECRLRRADGVYRWWLIRGVPVFDETGRTSKWFGTCTDIHEIKMIEQELKIAACAFESQEGMLVTDENRLILKVNHAFSLITGYSSEEVIGKTPALLKSGRQDAPFYQEMNDTLDQYHHWQGEIWNRRKNGEIYPEWLSISAVLDKTGKVTNYVANFSDISRLKKDQETIYKLANYDPLTQLPNRHLLYDRLRQAIVGCARKKLYGSILLIDLDDFKTLNDTKGHEVGDFLLQEVAQRIQANLHADDTVARIGSDEFVLILNGLAKESEQAAILAEMVAKRVHAAIKRPMELQGFEYHCSSSIGISLFNETDISADELLKHADTAMNQAKQSGRDTIQFFDPATQIALESRISLESWMRKALPDQLRLYYQIQVDIDGKATGAEALIRWHHPEKGIIPPLTFIPLAEKTGLIFPLGQWVLETACAQLKTWEQNHHTRHLILAINVSAKQFHQIDFVNQVMTALDQSGADPCKLKLELTESMLVENFDDIVIKMTELQNMGVKFSLDDFGTGFSSLSYLKRLPLNQLKIDQSFVRDALTDPGDAAIVRTVIALGQSLGLAVIAEGVENQEQRNFLAIHGCHHFQGYLYSQALPLQEFEHLLQQNQPG